MYTFLEGVIEEVQPFGVVLNVNGVGYELHVPLSTSAKAGSKGSKLRILTQLVVREDSHTLYGFLSEEERSAFLALTEKVSGIGPKTALNILSRLPVESLVHAVNTGNVALLSQCPGIGKKTAERLVLELKGFLSAKPTGSATDHPAILPQPGSMEDDAIAALITLGFKQPDASKKVARAIQEHGPFASGGELVKRALNS
jgi:Holliday junction DNA helicase RuvA